MLKRVVVTGMAGISPIGNNWPDVAARLKSNSTGIRTMQEWDKYQGLNTRLGAPAGFVRPEHYSRKQTRSMGRVALMATYVTELALLDAGLFDDPVLRSGQTGIAYGSCAGSYDALAEFGNMLINHTVNGLNATSYIRMMAHTAPVNIGLFFGINGRVYTTSSACTSSSQAIGYAYEAIKQGYQQVMVAGGAEELCAAEAAVFDTLFATSIRNDQPEQNPKPFDRDRDGLVIGEGAGSMILEEREHALARNAKIYAEVVGYGTNSDGLHVTQPDSASMQAVMRLALQDAGLAASAIGYVSAHGTATEHGDIAESHATAAVLGNKIPISALKAYTGHTLGACGLLEAWAGINMMNEGWFHPTPNLENIDPDCADLDYIMDECRELQCEHIMTNNFAFGGINTSLIFKRVTQGEK
jgi:3-oxoacyl-[acyl-carrier-protein] synthase II